MTVVTPISDAFLKEKENFSKFGKIIQRVPDDLEDKLNEAFEKRKNQILNTESEWKLGENGVVRYVSSTDGDDSNDGLSPETPWKTIEKIHEAQRNKTVRAGDVVLFKRGDEWHGKMITDIGITYSAYGVGAKPRLLASTAANLTEDWHITDVEGVYRFKDVFDYTRDVGNIVFNDGECYGQRVAKSLDEDVSLPAGSDYIVSNGINKWPFPPREFKSYKELAKIAFDIPESDLMYYHDRESGELFLYSRKGNPAECFSSIELCTNGHGIVGKSNVVIDNLCIKYSGSHGVRAKNCSDFTVRNCEIGFIGGSFMVPTSLARFGNAVELYGTTDGYYVYNNYIYQCFDCGPTVQWTGELSEGEIKIAKNIEFYGNALCEGALEVWFTPRNPTTETAYAKLINCKLYDNMVTGSGTGWKAYNHQKQEWCAFFGGRETTAEYTDCYIEDNYFWGERRHLIKSVPTTTKNGNGFNWRNNIIVHPLNEGSIGYLGENSAIGKGAPKQFWYSEKAVTKLVENGTFDKNYFYYTDGDEKNRRKLVDKKVKLFDLD